MDDYKPDARVSSAQPVQVGPDFNAAATEIDSRRQETDAQLMFRPDGMRLFCHMPNEVAATLNSLLGGSVAQVREAFDIPFVEITDRETLRQLAGARDWGLDFDPPSNVTRLARRPYARGSERA